MHNNQPYNIYTQDLEEFLEEIPLPSLYSLKDDEEAKEPKESLNPNETHTKSDDSESLFNRVMNSPMAPSSSLPISSSDTPISSPLASSVNLFSPNISTHTTNASHISSLNNKLKRTYSRRISIHDTKNTLKRYSSISDQDYLNFIENFESNHDASSFSNKSLVQTSSSSSVTVTNIPQTLHTHSVSNSSHPFTSPPCIEPIRYPIDEVIDEKDLESFLLHKEQDKSFPQPHLTDINPIILPSQPPPPNDVDALLDTEALMEAEAHDFGQEEDFEFFEETEAIVGSEGGGNLNKFSSFARNSSVFIDETENEELFNELYEESSRQNSNFYTSNISFQNEQSNLSNTSLPSDPQSIEISDEVDEKNQPIVIPSLKKEVLQSLGMWYFDKKRKKRRYIGLNGLIYEGSAAVKQSKLDKARADHPARLLRFQLVQTMHEFNQKLKILLEKVPRKTDHSKNNSIASSSSSESLNNSTVDNSFNSSVASSSISHSSPSSSSSNHENFYPDFIYSSLQPLSSWGLPLKILENYSNSHIKTLFPWQIDCLLSDYGSVLGEYSTENLIYSAPTSGGKTLVAELLILKKLAQNMQEMDFMIKPSKSTTIIPSQLPTFSTLNTKKKTIFYVVPFISLAEEKFTYFQEIWKDLSIGMRAYHREDGLDNNLGEDVELVICTIERANILLNYLLEEKREKQLSMVVIDEIHLLSDPSRGFLLEVMLSKIKFLLNSSVQIVGMSATLPNIRDLAQWLDAKLFITKFRPVSLDLLISYKKTIFHPQIIQKKIENNDDNNISNTKSVEDFLLKVQNFENSIQFGQIKLEQKRQIKNVPKDPDGFVGLCIDSLLKEESLLVFCNSKKRCELCALNIVEGLRSVYSSTASLSEFESPSVTFGAHTSSVISSSSIPHYNNLNEIIPRHSSSSLSNVPNSFSTIFQNTEQQLQFKRNLLLDKLSTTLVGLCPILRQTIPYGIAYHHAGLTHDERKLIEDSFRQGVLFILCTTSTLSAGVNLPAKRVIIRTLSTTFMPLTVSSFRQMSGRAGRLGQGTGRGEAIIMLSNSFPFDERKLCQHLLVSDIEPLTSNLHLGSGGGIEKLLLEMITTNCLKHEREILSFIKCTLFSTQHSSLEISQYVKNAMIFLKKEQFVLTSTTGSLSPSPLGKATIHSGIPPKEAKEILFSLQQGRNQLILKGGLHPLYLLTPSSLSTNTIEPDWANYYKLLTSFYQEYPEAQKIASLIGIRMEIVQKFIYEGSPRSNMSNNNKGKGTNTNSNNTNDTINNVSTTVVMSKSDEEKNKTYQLYKRFYNTIILFILTQEWPMTKILSFFSTLSRGQLQQLQKDSSTFCSMLTLFCMKLNWKTLAAVLSDYQSKLLYGTMNTDLLPLVRIGGEILTNSRAKILLDHGVKTPQDILKCHPNLLAKWFESSLPYYDRTVLNFTTSSSSATSVESIHSKSSREKAWQSCLRLAERILIRTQEYMKEETQKFNSLTDL